MIIKNGGNEMEKEWTKVILKLTWLGHSKDYTDFLTDHGSWIVYEADRA